MRNMNEPKQKALAPTPAMIEAATLRGPVNISPVAIESMLKAALLADPLFVNRIKAQALRESYSQMREDELDRNITDEDYIWDMKDVGEWMIEQAQILDNNPKAGPSPCKNKSALRSVHGA